MISKNNNIDVLIIGAGPAGLAAAIRAKEEGVSNVTIIERDKVLGGLLHQCIHNGFGLWYFGQDMAGPEYAKKFIDRVKEMGINILLDSMVLNITPDKKVTFCNQNGVQTLNPKAIVLAMGCRERTRESIMVSGNRPAGVFTAGTAQRFVNVEGYIPGKEVVILGSGDIGMIMARRLTLEGLNVKAVVEVLPYVGGLIRNEVQCLHDFDIDILLKHTVSWIHGKERVEGVTISEIDNNMMPIAGTEKDVDCDTLILSVGLIPENELSTMAGVKLDPITNGPIVDEYRMTNISGIFAGGNVVQVHDLVDNVSWESEIAGFNAARYAKGEKFQEGAIKLIPGENIRYIVPQVISGKEDVTLYMRVKDPKEMVMVKVGDVIKKTERVVKPSSMLTYDLSYEKHLSKLPQDTKEIMINCEEKGK
jgi:NADPH-dependent 2,4-dienoyl-CoA reductase/sulfur reductase-like enzyme